MSRKSGRCRGRRGRELVVRGALSVSAGLTDYERELLLPVAEQILFELFLPGKSDVEKAEKED